MSCLEVTLLQHRHVGATCTSMRIGNRNPYQNCKSFVMAGIPKNSVWAAMDYKPPRGRCNHKTSLMSPACPCLRFMLHPVKITQAATSFECDGCNHHASFHSLENAAEDLVLQRWAEQQAIDRHSQQSNVTIARKRKAIMPAATLRDDAKYASEPAGSPTTARRKPESRPHNAADVVEVSENGDETAQSTCATITS
nr:hypothetical protein CFP56_74373 [Quercus suber]